jgi:hypothetical protein
MGQPWFDKLARAAEPYAKLGFAAAEANGDATRTKRAYVQS